MRYYEYSVNSQLLPCTLAAPPRSLAGRSGEVLQPTRGSGFAAAASGAAGSESAAPSRRVGRPEEILSPVRAAAGGGAAADEGASSGPLKQMGARARGILDGARSGGGLGGDGAPSYGVPRTIDGWAPEERRRAGDVADGGDGGYAVPRTIADACPPPRATW